MLHGHITFRVIHLGVLLRDALAHNEVRNCMNGLFVEDWSSLIKADTKYRVNIHLYLYKYLIAAARSQVRRRPQTRGPPSPLG